MACGLMCHLHETWPWPPRFTCSLFPFWNPEGRGRLACPCSPPRPPAQVYAPAKGRTRERKTFPRSSPRWHNPGHHAFPTGSPFSERSSVSEPSKHGVTACRSFPGSAREHRGFPASLCASLVLPKGKHSFTSLTRGAVRTHLRGPLISVPIKS